VTLYLFPQLNPDGNVANRRYNARGTDLNRNFPVGWKPTGAFHAPGPRPFSEPESTALAEAVTSIGPDLILSIHSPLDYVHQSSRHPAAARAADAYREATALGKWTKDWLPTTPGGFERWAAERWPTVLVEDKAHSATPDVVARHTAGVLAAVATLTG
jgi:predicted deacylase